MVPTFQYRASDGKPSTNLELKASLGRLFPESKPPDLLVRKPEG